jgi:molybdate transport system substrate-binding protein
MSARTLKVLSAGAAQGLVTGLAGAFETETGYAIDATFGAVGAMTEKLRGGASADAIILTRALIDELAAAGDVVASSARDLGRVRTGVAVRAGEPRPDVGTPDALAALLRGATGVYFPDPERATAGIHCARVIEALGLRETIAARVRTYPNGATAMRALAQAAEAGAIGITQITEINNTPGVTLVGPLPREFELATVYTAAVCTRVAAPDAAARFVALVAGDASRAVRDRAGFEP